MANIKSYKEIFKTILSFVLLIPGAWLITEATYGPYLAYLNSRLATKQGLPYKCTEVMSELTPYLIPLILGVTAIWVGIVLWKKWKIVLGFSLVALGVIHLIPENPMGFAMELFGTELFTCQVSCRIFGSIYFFVGAGFIFWFVKEQKSLGD